MAKYETEGKYLLAFKYVSACNYMYLLNFILRWLLSLYEDILQFYRLPATNLYFGVNSLTITKL